MPEPRTGGAAWLALDGNTDSLDSGASCARCDYADHTPWWSVEFKTVVNFTRVRITGRSDGAVGLSSFLHSSESTQLDVYVAYSDPHTVAHDASTYDASETTTQGYASHTAAAQAPTWNAPSSCASAVSLTSGVTTDVDLNCTACNCSGNTLVIKKSKHAANYRLSLCEVETFAEEGVPMDCPKTFRDVLLIATPAYGCYASPVHGCSPGYVCKLADMSIRCHLASSHCHETEFAPGNDSCQVCMDGKHPNLAQSDCSPCAKGWAGRGGQCRPCSLGTVPGHDQRECEKCPSGMTTLGLGRTACVCKAGFYDVQRLGVVSCFDDAFDTFTAQAAQTRAITATNNTASPCVPCDTLSCISCSTPDHPGKPGFVIKDGWGLTVTGQHNASVLRLARNRADSVGGAHKSVKTLSIFKCPRKGACPANNQTGGERCANHARGILCGECDVTYRGSPTEPCSKCDSTWAAVVLKIVGIVIACATTLWVMRHRAIGVRLLKLLQRKKTVSSHSLHACSLR